MQTYGRLAVMAAFALCCLTTNSAYAGTNAWIETNISCGNHKIKTEDASAAGALTKALMQASAKGAKVSACQLESLLYREKGQQNQLTQLPIADTTRWGAVSIAANGYKPAAFGRYWKALEEVAVDRAEKNCRIHAGEHAATCITFAGQGGYLVGIRCKPSATDLRGFVGISHRDTLEEAFKAAMKTAANGSNPGYCEVRAVVASNNGPVGKP